MATSKRFLIFSQYFSPEIGASQSRLAALARELVAAEHQVEIVTAFPHHLKGQIFPGYRHKFYSKEAWEGIPIHRTWIYASQSGNIPGRLLNYGSFATSSVLGLARAQKPDYVLVESPPLFLAIPGALYSSLKGVPTILNVADLWPESAQMLGVLTSKMLLRAGEGLERWAYRRARYLNAVTQGIRDGLRFKRDIADSKILFFPNGVDTATFYPHPPDRSLIQRYNLDGKHIILYAGTHGLAYKLELLLQAAEQLQENDIVFMLVGDGYTKKGLMHQASARGITNVLFVDSQPETEMPKYFSVALASVVPLADNKLFEGTRPAKIFPSLASGVPVIYAGAGEGGRVIAEAGGGLIIPPESPRALVQAARMLLEQPSVSKRMAASGRSYAVAHYSWKHIVSQWLSQLQEREIANGTPW